MLVKGGTGNNFSSSCQCLCKRACHPGSHCWDYGPDALPLTHWGFMLPAGQRLRVDGPLMARTVNNCSELSAQPLLSWSASHNWWQLLPPCSPNELGYHGLYSLSGKTSYRQISQSLEAARLGVIMIVSLWNLAGFSAAVLLRCLSNFRAIEKV